MLNFMLKINKFVWSMKLRKFPRNMHACWAVELNNKSAFLYRNQIHNRQGELRFNMWFYYSVVPCKVHWRKEEHTIFMQKRTHRNKILAHYASRKHWDAVQVIKHRRLGGEYVTIIYEVKSCKITPFGSLL